MAGKLSADQFKTLNHLIRLSHEKSYRTTQQTCLVSGKKLLSDISRINVLEDIMSGTVSSDHRSHNTHCNVAVNLIKRVAKISDSRSDSVVASVAIPTQTHLNSDIKLIAAFQGIRDEGELGTLTRSASALGFEHITFLEKCADIFSIKSVRASQTALWTTPYNMCTSTQLLKFAKAQKMKVVQLGGFGASPDSLEQLKKDLNKSVGVIVLLSPHPKKGFSQIPTRFSKAPTSVAGSCLLHAVKEAVRSGS